MIVKITGPLYSVSINTQWGIATVTFIYTLTSFGGPINAFKVCNITFSRGKKDVFSFLIDVHICTFCKVVSFGISKIKDFAKHVTKQDAHILLMGVTLEK